MQNKNFSGNTRRPYKSSWSRRGNQKSFTLTSPQNLANPVKIFPGIILHQHRTDRKLMGLPREQCAESRKGHLRYCCNQVWTKNGGQIPWNVAAICEIFQISCLMGRHHVRGDSEYHFTHQLFQRPVATASVRQESLASNIPWLCTVLGRILGRRHYGRRH